jgi:cyclopropane-fatty-acyl-phospholipid synthase
MALARLIEELLGRDLPVGVRAYDGSYVGPDDPPAEIVIRSPDALRRILTAPGELGFARAYVAGDIDVEGDIYAALALQERLPEVRLEPRMMARAVRELGGWREVKPLPPPPEEVRLHGLPHTRARDRAAVGHHYNVSNKFYEMVLGQSLTYSCAVFEQPSDSLEQAQANKYELICRKLDLQQDMRLLDVGCGWGGMVTHAALAHGARAVGVTVADQQAELADKRVFAAGVDDRVDVRQQDYRDVHDGPYDAISSIGMFEHVGEGNLSAYFEKLRSLLKPGGRLLNHGITRPPTKGVRTRARLAPRSFVNRYVFPDGALHEVGKVVSALQEAGFEVRHTESLREHYGLTLRHWVSNLESNWDAAVKEVGANRARVWRLYMAASAVNFEAARSQIHQILAVRTGNDGSSGLPLRPHFDQ